MTTSEPFSASGPEADRDPQTGRFLKGNTSALVTGARSVAFWRAAERERLAMREALLRQRGFTSEQDAPPALAALADGAAQALLIRNATFTRLMETGGPITTHDRRRDVLKVWETASDRALKHLQAIGLDAHEPDADLSIAEILGRRAAPAATGEATDTADDGQDGAE